jgi:murein DD-endopeptidase MepM/ murein hydrolase activator NlpD
MERFKKERLENIQTIFEEKTGVNVTKTKNHRLYAGKRTAAVTGIVFCFIIVSAFVYSEIYLSNNNFAFGQNGIYIIDTIDSEESTDPENSGTILRFAEWVWPTVSERISASYGTQKNGVFSDHINIAGNSGDEIYSVAGATVVQTGYETTWGYYIEIDLGEGITVKYGHLKEVFVEEGELLERGQRIGEMGMSGAATGENLSFAVYVNGEAVNPLAE